jgi:hypothetical protein
MAGFKTPTTGIIATHTGFDEASGMHSYLFRNENTDAEETVQSAYPPEDTEDESGRRVPGFRSRMLADYDTKLWKRLAPVFKNLQSKDQRGFYDRAIAPVLRSIPAYFAGAFPDIAALLSYVPGPEELLAMGYKAATGDDPFGMLERQAAMDKTKRKLGQEYGSKAQQIRFQQYLRQADAYAQDKWGFKPFEASVGTDMTPEARGIWEKMVTSGLEFAVSGPVMVKGVTLPAKILQDGAKFIYSKMAKDSVRELGEAALKPENVRSLIDKANDAYSVFKKQGRRNIAAEMAFGATAGPMTEGSLSLLEEADPDAAGWVKMLTAGLSGIAGPLAARGAWTTFLQGPAIRVASRVLIDPILRPGHAASDFVQKHLGGTKADRVTIASTARLLEEAIKDGRHVHEASGLAFTTPELARTEANILRAEIQLKRERLSQETSPEARSRLEQEIEADEMTVGNLNRTAKFYEDVLESAAKDQTPGAANRFFQKEAERLVQRREQFFDYIEGQFKRAYDDLDFNGKPGGTPEELRKDFDNSIDNPEYVPEFEINRRKLVMGGDPRGVESSELLWLDPQTAARVKGIKQDLSAKMDEGLAKAQGAAQDRVDYWKESVQSYLANRGLKSVEDLPKAERDLVGDLIRGTYDDAGREWRAFVTEAYRRVDGLDVKVTENIVFPEGSLDPSNGKDISGMTVEEWATGRFDSLSPEEAFNPKELPPQLAQLAGSRSVIAQMNRRQREAAAAGRASGAEEKISNLEVRRDDAIAQRDEVEVRLNEQREADRILSEDNYRTLDTYAENVTRDLDDTQKRAVGEFMTSPDMDWGNKDFEATARGLAPPGLEKIFAEIAKQKKRIFDLGEGTTFSAAARVLDTKMEGFAAAAKRAQDSIDDITNKFLGVGDDVQVPETGRLTARDANGDLVREGTSAEDVRTVVADLAEAARVEKAVNGRSPKYRRIQQTRETVEQLLDSRTFPDLDAGQLRFAREADRVRRTVDEAQGPILEKDRSSEVKVEVESAAEKVLPQVESPTTAAAKLRQLQEATAEVPDFVTITWGDDGIPVAAIDEAALDGATSLFARTDSPFEMVPIGQARTPFEIRVKQNAPATEGAFKIAEGILLERLALKFPDGVDSKGLESFRENNKAAIKFLEDNGRPDIPDLVKNADSLAVQLDTLNSLRQDKTRRLLTELVENGSLKLEGTGLTIDDYVKYIGTRRKRISEDRAFSEVLNADPGRAVEQLFEDILTPGNKRPKQDMQEFMSRVVRGNRQAEKGFQASVIGQLFARSLSTSDTPVKGVGDLAFRAFDPVRLRELLSNPRVRIIIQEAFPDNDSLLSGLDDLADVAFETSNFTKGGGAHLLLKPSESVNLSGWGFLGRISALGAANKTRLVNALWAGGAGSTVGRHLGQRITGSKVKDIVIDAALNPEKGVDLSLRTADQASGFWRTAAEAAIDVINVPGAVVKRPAATLPVLLRVEEELDEAAPGPQASARPTQPPSRRVASAPLNPPIGASILGQTNVLAPPPQGQAPTPQGRIDPQRMAQMRDMGMPLFRGKEGGIVSIPRKPRQLVG